MRYIISWLFKRIIISCLITVYAVFFSLYIPNISFFTFLCILYGVPSICILFVLNGFLKRRRSIKNFLKNQLKNRQPEYDHEPIISEEELRQGVFKYNISCENSNSFAFHALLYAKQSEEILGK